MNYPIILNRTQDPNLLLLNENGGLNTKSGDYDYPFYKFLKNEKGLPVYINYSFNNYPPDVLYFDKQKNVLIDIEIDEPYAHEGKLTHCLNNNNDTYRNEYFINNGIHVIRFSERQIATRMNLCFLIIDYFIKSLIDIKFETKINHLILRIKEPLWSTEEANRMKSNNTRECYPYDVIDQVNSTQIIRKDFALEEIVNLKLRNFKNDVTIVIPTKLQRLRNPQNDQRAFYYYGPHFSNDEYNGFSKELIKGRIIDQDSFVYNYFEEVFTQKIIFKNSSTEYVPLILISESTDNEPTAVIKI